MKKFSLVILLFISLVISVQAQSLGTVDDPPRLRDLEGIAVQIVYFAWGAAGLIFTVLLISIGVRYMLTAGDQQKQQALKDKGKNWVLGLILFFLAYPIVLTFYTVTGIGEGTSCYANITTPGFHFFFPEVCTDPEAEGTHAYGEPCRAGIDLGSDQKCCEVGITAGLILPVNVGIKRLDFTGRVMTYIRNSSDNTCVPTTTGCFVGTGCPCSYTFDPSKTGADRKDRFITGCTP